MTQSPEAYFAGLILFGLVAGSAAFTGSRLRAAYLSDWLGAPGFLVSSLLTLSVLLAEATLLGVAGLLKPWALAVLGIAVAGFFWLRPLSPRKDGVWSPPEQASVPLCAGAVATIFAALTVAQWGSFGSLSLDFGVTNFDSVWYHLPFSAEFARTGTVFTDFRPETVFLNWLYPFNSELLHAVGMSVTGRDFLSLLLNYGWLALGLLAAWVAGRPWGRSHLTVALASIVFAAHMLVVREPGTAKNDIMAVSLILAAIAVLLGSAGRSGSGPVGTGAPLVVVGLALGMAAGTKVTVLPLAVLVAIAAVIASPPGRRLGATLSVSAAGLVTGGIWYARNVVETGNPFPQLRELGPLSLPGPERLQEARPDFNVFHYLVDGEVWAEYLVPGLERALGPLWPVLILLFVIGTVAVAIRGPGRTARALAVASLGGAVLYLFTPLSAAGPEGEPTAFSINLRFLAPALAAGLVLIPSLPLFDRPVARRLLLLLLAVLFLTGTRMDALVELSGRYFGAALALVTVILPVIAWWKREEIRIALGGRSPGRVLVPVALGLFALASWPLANHYFDSRYRDFEPELGMAPAYRWAGETTDRRIALAGTTAGFRDYGFFGPELSNEVRYVGRPAPASGFDVIQSCPEFRRAVNRIAPDFLVTSPFLDFNTPGKPGASPERDWVRGEPAIERIAGGQRVEVWAVDGELDPAGCPSDAPGSAMTPGLVSP